MTIAGQAEIMSCKITKASKLALFMFALCFRYIRSINRQNLKYKLAPNHLVDLTDEEYDGHAGWYKPF